MNRNITIWIAFGLCACLVVGAMSWLTRGVLRTERDRARAESRAELQERFRLSLWRMDSLGAALLLEENSVPTNLFLSPGREGTLPVLARFESPDGAALRCTGPENAQTLVGAALPGLLPKVDVRDEDREEPKAQSYQQEILPPQSKLRGGQDLQDMANISERASRERLLDQTLSKQWAAPSAGAENAAKSAPSPQRQAAPTDTLQSLNPTGELKPLWFEGSLFLVRRSLALPTFLQGILLDHDALSSQLLAEAAPLLPQARLAPVTNGEGDSLTLASFPFRLSAAPLEIPAGSIPRSILVSLSAGWIAALVAMLAAFFLIASVMKLSERRASFVSAVTHELRTPLTTFRLYSDMLGAGAVREEKRQSYLEILSREADRLSHLVENVLAFSQVERGSARACVREVELNALLESMRERFESRLAPVGLSLRLVPGPPLRLRLDASALEHILFNLIDNAAKYAADSDPPLVTIETESRGRETEIRVSDHGPGIPPEERARVFRPFHKSAKQAAETKPGVGLGLSLSKRLARAMGGELTCRPAPAGTGAVFVLTLRGGNQNGALASAGE